MSGDAVRPLTGAEQSARRGLGVPEARPGSSVRLWQLPGRWRVWSAAPGRSSRWLQPADQEARDLYARLRAEPGCGSPIVGDVTQGVIQVECKHIRSGEAGWQR